MATLAEYETALLNCQANPTPANAALAALKHSLIPKITTADRVSVTRPDLPDWIVQLAKAHRPSGSSILLARPGYGDGR